MTRWTSGSPARWPRPGRGASELAGAVLRIAAADHGTGGDVQGGEQRGGAIGLRPIPPRDVSRVDRAGIVVRPAAPSRGPRCRAPSSATRSIRPRRAAGKAGRGVTDSGSVESLKVLARCGCRPKARQMRSIVGGAWPIALTIERKDLCVAPGGVASRVRRMVSAMASSPILRGVPGSSSSLSGRCVAKRRRHFEAATSRSCWHRHPPRRRSPCSPARPRQPTRFLPTAPSPARSCVRSGQRFQLPPLRRAQCDRHRRLSRHQDPTIINMIVRTSRSGH